MKASFVHPIAKFTTVARLESLLCTVSSKRKITFRMLLPQLVLQQHTPNKRTCLTPVKSLLSVAPSSVIAVSVELRLKCCCCAAASAGFELNGRFVYTFFQCSFRSRWVSDCIWRVGRSSASMFCSMIDVEQRHSHSHAFAEILLEVHYLYITIKRLSFHYTCRVLDSSPSRMQVHDQTRCST
ncbi:hypothetical protein BDQ17DRAFT_624936 [Cyathus striatus]|nr:hypothetical protein BDQ17DRAFT_624936 [Cyathus striatus]